MRHLPSLLVLLWLTVLAVSAAYSDDPVTDAIAREFSVDARELVTFVVTDAVAREFSVDARELQAAEVTDAVAREFTVDARELVTFVVTDAVAREFSVDARELQAAEVTDAVAREFSVAVLTPDLTVSVVDGPVVAVAGQTAELTWTVINIGEGPANGSWIDRVCLSSDEAIGDDVWVADFGVNGPLAASGSYTRIKDVPVPPEWEGAYYFVVITDADDTLIEPDGEDNNATIAGAPTMIEQPPPPVVNWSTIDGGGGTSANNGYRVRGTIGQPDVETLAAGGYVLRGGFWAGTRFGFMDCNDNGIADEDEAEYIDIGLFVDQLLADGPDPVYVCMFDPNSDGTLNGNDIQGFVNRLLLPP